MKRFTVVSIMAGGLAVLVCSSSAETNHPVQPFMRQKLNYAQSILEGITLEKFDLSVTNAVLLRDMSKTNTFLMMRNPDYMQRTTNFQVAVDGLIASAKANDLEAATEAYTRVARACVECHKTFRREQFIRPQLER